MSLVFVWRAMTTKHKLFQVEVDFVVTELADSCKKWIELDKNRLAGRQGLEPDSRSDSAVLPLDDLPAS